MRMKFPDGVLREGLADDVALIITKHITKEIEHAPGAALELVAGWRVDHGLELAVNKTEAAMFTK